MFNDSIFDKKKLQFSSIYGFEIVIQVCFLLVITIMSWTNCIVTLLILNYSNCFYHFQILTYNELSELTVILKYCLLHIKYSLFTLKATKQGFYNVTRLSQFIYPLLVEENAKWAKCCSANFFYFCSKCSQAISGNVFQKKLFQAEKERERRRVGSRMN